MTGKNILITGPRGLLGSSLLKNSSNYNVSAFDEDITNFKEVNKKLSIENPDVIIHTAAYTDVENSEIYPEKAYHVNTLGTYNLVNYCLDKKVLFVYVSSTGVYGSFKQKETYNEFDDVNPTTIHHKSKYQGEKIVTNHLNRYLILRTGWLFGGEKNYKKNFIYNRYLEAQNKNFIYSDTSQLGNPTYVENVVKQIYLLIYKGQYGTFNCVDKAENISRYTYVKKIIELLNIDCIVKPAGEKKFKRLAPVSKNESANNYKLNLLELNIMEDWNVSLGKYIHLLKKNLNG